MFDIFSFIITIFLLNEFVIRTFFCILLMIQHTRSISITLIALSIKKIITRIALITRSRTIFTCFTVRIYNLHKNHHCSNRVHLCIIWIVELMFHSMFYICYCISFIFHRQQNNLLYICYILHLNKLVDSTVHILRNYCHIYCIFGNNKCCPVGRKHLQNRTTLIITSCQWRTFTLARFFEYFKNIITFLPSS